MQNSLHIHGTLLSQLLELLHRVCNSCTTRSMVNGSRHIRFARLPALKYTMIVQSSTAGRQGGPMLNVISSLSTSVSCLFLVHPDIGKLEQMADALLSTYDWARLSVGKELSNVLLPTRLQRRSHKARQWMSARLGSIKPGPVLCTEIDLLFEPQIELDPPTLFHDLGRICHIVVTWPGSYQGDILTYAVPEHSHYRTWRKPGLPVVTLK